MFITVDGPSGAGKTTQAFLLHKRLSLEYTCFQPVMYAIENIPSIIQKQSRYTDLIAALMATHAIPCDNCVVGNFWRHVEFAYQLNKNDLNALLAFFQTGITLGGRRAPDLSIYLSIPYDVHISRMIQRDLHQNILVEPDKDALHHFEERKRFWHTISGQISYFHVVDGTLPVEDVHASIMTLIESSNFQ
jgi:thymidylate kinase